MFDVIVVGGGPVGACAGALLARGAPGVAGLSVALLEPRPPAVAPANARIDPRVVALSRASERLLRRAGAWTQIPAERLSAYERMRIWHESIAPTSGDVLVFDAADVAEPNLGYIAENRALQTALLAAFAEAGGHLEPAPFSSLSIGAEEVTVSTPQGVLEGRLVIGADGAQSVLRAAAGLAVEVRAYGQTAIVANVATERPHQSTAWQRFMRDGTLAFLPLADGTSSIVWSADDARAARLVSLSDAAFAAELERAADGALGSTRLLSERLSFPLMRLAAQRYVTQRVALIGDAAHVVHPLAGQGMNLGLLDAAALAQQVKAAVATREDPGALRALRAYERWRKSEVAAMAVSIDTFDRLLAHGAGPVARLAQRGLSWVNASQELRRFFIRRALGLSGELPEAAR
ncbi:MAG TPA: FAD-dependent monooxygenase [Steroidobacteraceae bacterium]|jgi:2-octaprenylphenol hydroxylase|nr:FAD-dependent monooxygenase [Steroidobacteraceae bacterium]